MGGSSLAWAVFTTSTQVGSWSCGSRQFSGWQGCSQHEDRRKQERALAVWLRAGVPQLVAQAKASSGHVQHYQPKLNDTISNQKLHLS
eukprot:scaffold28713_cov15-Tisochrysis_lutea.AAC.1